MEYSNKHSSVIVDKDKHNTEAQDHISIDVNQPNKKNSNFSFKAIEEGEPIKKDNNQLESEESFSKKVSFDNINLSKAKLDLIENNKQLTSQYFYNTGCYLHLIEELELEEEEELNFNKKSSKDKATKTENIFPIESSIQNKNPNNDASDTLLYKKRHYHTSSFFKPTIKKSSKKNKIIGNKMGSYNNKESEAEKSNKLFKRNSNSNTCKTTTNSKADLRRGSKLHNIYNIDISISNKYINMISQEEEKCSVFSDKDSKNSEVNRKSITINDDETKENIVLIDNDKNTSSLYLVNIKKDGINNTNDDIENNKKKEEKENTILSFKDNINTDDSINDCSEAVINSINSNNNKKNINNSLSTLSNMKNENFINSFNNKYHMFHDKNEFKLNNSNNNINNNNNSNMNTDFIIQITNFDEELNEDSNNINYNNKRANTNTTANINITSITNNNDDDKDDIYSLSKYKKLISMKKQGFKALSKNTFSYFQQFTDNFDLFTLIKVNKRFFQNLKHNEVYRMLIHILKHKRSLEFLIANNGMMLSYYISRLNIQENSVEANSFVEFVVKLLSKDLKNKLKIQSLLGFQGFKYLSYIDFSKFTVLDISSCKIGDEGAELFLDIFPYNNTIENLNVSINQLSSIGTKNIFKAFENHDKIKTINISGNNCYAEGMTQVEAFLKLNITIESLNLSHNTIMDTGCKSVAEGLLFNRSLNQLDLSHNKITNDGVIALAEIYNSENFTKIKNFATNTNANNSILNDSYNSNQNSNLIKKGSFNNKNNLSDGNNSNVDIDNNSNSNEKRDSINNSKNNNLPNLSDFKLKNNTANITANTIQIAHTTNTTNITNNIISNIQNKTKQRSSILSSEQTALKFRSPQLNLKRLENQHNTLTINNFSINNNKIDNRLLSIKQNSNRSNRSNFKIHKRGSIFFHDYEQIQFSNLQILNLNNNKINDAGLEVFFTNLTKIGNKPTLSTINLSYNSFSSKSMTKISEFIKLSPSLTKLNLNNNNIGGCGEVLGNALETNIVMRQLLVNNCSLSEDCIIALITKIRKNPHSYIEVLDIGSNNFSAEVCDCIADNISFTRINNLNLSDNQIDDDMFKTLYESIIEKSDVETLDLSLNDITDDGVVEFIVYLEKITSSVFPKDVYSSNNSSLNNSFNNANNNYGYNNNNNKRFNMFSNTTSNNNNCSNSNLSNYCCMGCLNCINNSQLQNLTNNILNTALINSIPSINNNNTNKATHLPKLKKLNLSINAITDQSAQNLFEFIAFNEYNTLLSELKLNGCDITQESCEMICSSIINNNYLEKLELSNCKLNIDSIKTIINACRSAMKLSSINLSKNTDNPKLKNKFVKKEELTDILSEFYYDKKDFKIEI